MARWQYFVLALLTAWGLRPSDAGAYGEYRYGMPNADKIGCKLCHDDYDPPPGAVTYRRNPFGDDAKRLTQNTGYRWNVDLAKVDSDGDGYTNGEELQELTGLWEPTVLQGGQIILEVGNRSFVTNPGLDTALNMRTVVPHIVFDPIDSQQVAVGNRLTVTFSGYSTALGRTMSFSFTGSDEPPEGAWINGDLFSWVPPDSTLNGVHRALIEMTDGTQADTHYLFITVSGGVDPPDKPDPPEPPGPVEPVVRVTDYKIQDFDFNRSRKVDFEDFLAFIIGFQTGDLAYDFNKSRRIDFEDFLFFAYYFGQRVVTEETFRTPTMDPIVFEPVDGGEFVYSADGLFEQAIVADFYIGKYEVTNAQYLKFWEHQGRPADRTPKGFDGKFFMQIATEKPDHPVVGVDQEDARAYCAWVGGRLPTWQEWMLAAMGQGKRPYAFDGILDPRRANYLGSGDPYEPGATPVGYYDGRTDGTFQTVDSFSPCGAYDLTGNVAEWVVDTRTELGQKEGLVAGGSFMDGVWSPALKVDPLRAVLTWMAAGAQTETVGFRFARDR